MNQCGRELHYSVDLRIQTYTEPVPLKYGKLATKYPWIYGHFHSAESGYTEACYDHVRTESSPDETPVSTTHHC